VRPHIWQINDTHQRERQVPLHLSKLQTTVKS
jgi:hypothetical protein